MPGFLGRTSSIFRKFSHAKTKQDIINDGYKIVVATGNDIDRVRELVRRSFFKDEPSIVGCGITLENLSQSLQRYVVGDLSDGRSLLAVSSGGRLLGACLSGELLARAARRPQRMAGEAAEDPRAAALLRFWAHLEETARLPDALGLTRVWEVEILATDPAARGLGIAKELMVGSRELARKSGFPALCVFCTSEYSAKLCRSLRMRHHLDIPYSQYRDASGRQIITPPPPHVRVSIYVQDLIGGHVSTTKKCDALHSTDNR